MAPIAFSILRRFETKALINFKNYSYYPVTSFKGSFFDNCIIVLKFK